MQLYWDKGFERTSMADLVKATGMAKPGLYANLGDKEQIFQKALEHYDETVVCPMLEKLLSPSTPLKEALRQSLSGMMHSLRGSGLPMGCFVINSTFECTGEKDRISEYLAQMNAKRRDAYLERLDHAKADGELSKGADTLALANFFTGQSAAIGAMARSGLPLSELDAMVEVALSALPEDEKVRRTV